MIKKILYPKGRMELKKITLFQLIISFKKVANKQFFSDYYVIP